MHEDETAPSGAWPLAGRVHNGDRFLSAMRTSWNANTPHYWPFELGSSVITLRPRQNGRHFADDTFKRIFLNENVRISFQISLKLVPKGPINNIPALVQIMAWRRPGDKPLSKPMMTQFNDIYIRHSASMSYRWSPNTRRLSSSVLIVSLLLDRISFGTNSRTRRM